MPFKKIKGVWDKVKPCLSPQHNPPSHIALPAGYYEWTCPACGHKIPVSVSGVIL